MKIKGFIKIVLLSLGLAVLIVAVLVRVICNEEELPNQDLIIDYKQSWLYDFVHDENGYVVIKCNIVIFNNSEKSKKFYLMMDVSEERERDFVKQNYASSYTEKGYETATFELWPKEEKSLTVYFKAVGGRTKTKKDRRIPGNVYIVPVE